MQTLQDFLTWFNTNYPKAQVRIPGPCDCRRNCNDETWTMQETVDNYLNEQSQEDFEYDSSRTYRVDEDGIPLDPKERLPMSNWTGGGAPPAMAVPETLREEYKSQ